MTTAIQFEAWRFIPTTHTEVGAPIRLFARIHVIAAAEKAGMMRAEHYELVIGALYEEHVYRVYRVKRAMDAHPPAPTMPHEVRDALEAMRAIEALMEDFRVPRLPAEVIHERVAVLEEVRV